MVGVRQSVKRYLKGRRVLRTKKSQISKKSSYSQDKTQGWIPERSHLRRKQGEYSHIKEELAIELMLQRHSYPKFYFKNLFF